MSLAPRGSWRMGSGNDWIWRRCFNSKSWQGPKPWVIWGWVICHQGQRRLLPSQIQSTVHRLRSDLFIVCNRGCFDLQYIIIFLLMRILSISIIIALFIQGSQVAYALIFRLYSLFLHSRASRTMGCPSSSQESGAHIVSWTGTLSRMSIMQELQVFNLSMFTCFLVEEWAPRTMSTNLLASSDLQTIASSGLI